ncbi:MAG: hypothetical protein ABI689_16055 [Thermoanaerobaculia bacterium]
MRPCVSSAALCLALVGALVPAAARPEAVNLRLFGPGSATSDVQSDAQFSPDGEWVVARWDALSDGIDLLFAVRRDGRERHQLSPPSPFSVESFVISPDSRYVVYEAKLLSNGVRELWSVPIAGPTANARMSPAWTEGTGVNEYGISPDSSRVVVYGDFDQDNISELWSAPIAGPTGSTVKLNPPPVANAEVFEWQISPDSARVVFAGDIAQVDRLSYWSVPLAGPSASAVKLNGTAPAGGTLNNADPFVISPDSSWLVMHGDLETADVHELWRVPIAGPANAAVKIHPDAVSGGEVEVGDYEISPDSNYVVFSGDLVTDGLTELWSSDRDATPGTAVKLSGSTIAAGDVGQFEIAPDSSRVVFHGDLIIDNGYWLFSRPLDGSGTRLVVTIDLVIEADADVSRWVLTADSRDVIYEANPNDTTRLELYRRRIADGGDFQRLSGPTPTFTDVQLIGGSPEGRGALYLADTSFANAFLLWIADDWIFSANFEEGTFIEWTSSVP